jgi:hypothetical protein
VKTLENIYDKRCQKKLLYGMEILVWCVDGVENNLRDSGEILLENI